MPPATMRQYVARALSPHRVRHVLRLDARQWRFVRGEIARLLQQATVQPGEMVGVLAAMSIAAAVTPAI